MSRHVVPLEPFITCLEECPRLLIFTGKGGVGKTTCAATAAIALADQGCDTLLFSTDPAHSLGDSLRVRVGPQPQPVPGVEHLWAVEIDAHGVLNQFRQRFGDALFKLLIHTTYLSEEDARAMLHLDLPGLDELMGLHQVMEFVSGKEPRFRHLVWDSAPTGHTLRLLELPALIDRWVRALAEVQWKYRDLLLQTISPEILYAEEGDLMLTLKRTIRAFTAAMRDPKISRLIPVTAPERMASAETVRLVASLREMQIPVRYAVVNRLHPFNGACSFCTRRHRAHQHDLTRLAEELKGLRLLHLPARPRPVRGINQLRRLSP